jgi:hypothetical protein
VEYALTFTEVLSIFFILIFSTSERRDREAALVRMLPAFALYCVTYGSRGSFPGVLAAYKLHWSKERESRKPGNNLAK